MWNLEGMEVTGKYMGEFPVTGVVRESRVKYGGGICHHVILSSPVFIYDENRERVILEHEFIETVRG
jgi:hypothetical protein